MINTLDVRDAMMVGHSGGGEVARYIGRHGSKRMKKTVLVAAVPPVMLKTAANPKGLPMLVFDAIRAGVAGDRSQYYALDSSYSPVLRSGWRSRGARPVLRSLKRR